MRNLLIVAIVCLVFISCEKEKNLGISGSFSGKFFRTTPAGHMPESQVTVHLNNGAFSGQSSDARYPAICHGAVSKSSGKLVFASACMWTADFDWTLILDGEYQYEYNGERLKFWKQTGDNIDTYDLVKE